jgi:hypothetical protein
MIKMRFNLLIQLLIVKRSIFSDKILYLLKGLGLNPLPLNKIKNLKKNIHSHYLY